MSLPPLRFEPLLKARAWGGRGLEHFGRRLSANATIGESWDLADLPPSIAEGISTVAEGPLQGRTLAEIREQDGESLLGGLSVARTGGVPILIKLLDARDNLSVQVHPDPAYARAHPEAYVKNEAWYVLQAEPDAVIYRGVDPSIDAHRFRRDLERERVLEDLVRIPVRRGDCIRLPSGICHALGAGVLVAEVQTPSDTTFRVWDWNRHDPARPLHLDQAMACMRFGDDQDDGRPPVVRTEQAPSTVHHDCRFGRICETDDFTIHHVGVETDSPRTVPILRSDAPTVLTGVAGASRVVDERGRSARLAPGDTVLVPAAHANASLELPPDAQALWVDLGSRSAW